MAGPPAVGDDTREVRGAGHDLGVDAARDTARRLGEQRGTTPLRVPLGEAAGAVLAAPLHARGDVPVADSSAMDGFAVRGHGPWTVVGRVMAGGAPAPALRPDEAVEVATGALVPGGTDRVLPVEVVAREGSRLRLDGPEPGRRHVRPRGEECAAGELLLPTGSRVRPGVLGLAAGTGSDDLLVRPRPRAVALLTGDELLLSGLPSPGQVRDAIGPLLPTAVASLGGDLHRLDRCGDAPGDLDTALGGLLLHGCDVVVTCGMAGAGPADRLRPWLARVGARLVVDGVAVRPGHPMVLAQLPDGRPLVGLPGNPLAAVAGLLLLLGPLLDGMSAVAPRVAERAVLRGWQHRGRPASALVPVRRLADGVVEPSGPSGPAQLRGLAAADAVALVPLGWQGRTAVELLRLP